MAGRKPAGTAGTRKKAGRVREAAPGYGVVLLENDEAPRKKNIRLHQSKIDEAMAVLGTSTETETIEAALDLVVFRKELSDGIRAMRGADLLDLFGEDE